MTHVLSISPYITSTPTFIFCPIYPLFTLPNSHSTKSFHHSLITSLSPLISNYTSSQVSHSPFSLLSILYTPTFIQLLTHTTSFSTLPLLLTLLKPSLNSLQTIQPQLLFFPFILYLPMIDNSIFFFQLNSP